MQHGNAVSLPGPFRPEAAGGEPPRLSVCGATLRAMTGAPMTARRLPLTVADYLAIPENGEVRYELQEGVPIGSPSPPADHHR